jgi:hypothetical protein
MRSMVSPSKWTTQQYLLSNLSPFFAVANE